MQIPFPSSITKRKNDPLNKKVSYSNATSATTSVTNDDSTIVSSFYRDENNTIFKGDIEASLKKEVTDQLQLYNDAMMEIINQRFTSFQILILKTMKILVIQMIPQLSIISNDPIYFHYHLMTCITLNQHPIHIKDNSFTTLTHYKQLLPLLTLTYYHRHHTPAPPCSHTTTTHIRRHSTTKSNFTTITSTLLDF